MFELLEGHSVCLLYPILVTLVTLRGCCYDTHFADGITEAQRNDMTCPKRQELVQKVALTLTLTCLLRTKLGENKAEAF